MKEMVDYNNKSIRIVGMFIVLPIAIICGLGGSLLSIWLGPDMEKYKWLLMLMTLHLSVNLAVSPIFQVQTACNKVRTPAIVTIILGGINLLLAIYFSKYTSIGIYGIALAGAIVLTGKNLLFTPVYNAIITGQKPFAYVKGVIPVAITTVLMRGIAYAMDYFLVIDSFIKLVGAAVVVAVIYLPVAWFGMLKKAERAEAIKSVKKRLKKA
jgi:membrane protein EpsK